MALSKYVKSVKVINRRMAQLVKDFGATDSTYQYMVNRLMNLEQKGLNIHQTKNGVWQATTSERGYKLTEKDIEKFLSYQTSGEKIKIAKNEIMKETGEKPTREDAIKRVKENNEIKNFIEEHKEDIYKIDELKQAVKRTRVENDARLYRKEAIDLLNMYSTHREQLTEYNVFKKETL